MAQRHITTSTTRGKNSRETKVIIFLEYIVIKVFAPHCKEPIPKI
jgi:hypothetical protein